MTKYSFIKNLEQDGWELRIGGYMKNDYVISDEKHNGVGIFIEDTDDDLFYFSLGRAHKNRLQNKEENNDRAERNRHVFKGMSKRGKQLV